MPMRLLATVLVLVLGLAAAQEPAASDAPATPALAPPAPAAAPPRVEIATIAARPEDVATIESIIQATYETISGPAGQPRQWARDRSLYIPNTVLVATGARRDEAGQIRLFSRVLDYQTYAGRVDAGFVREGFFEREIHRVTHRYGNIANVLSTYESRKTADGPPLGRGVNSFQLYFDGARWWIISVVWDSERPKNPIPKELLP
jgi:hypothetical protein